MTFKPRAKTQATRQAGFSLLEVLVAFVILALVATALFRLFSGGLVNAGAAADWSRALLVAQSQLELAAAGQPLREGEVSGTDGTGQIRWATKIAPYVAPDVDPELERLTDALPTRLFRVSVDVRFAGANGVERALSLATVRIGPRSAL
jgi:general secretion pathway protein I